MHEARNSMELLLLRESVELPFDRAEQLLNGPAETGSVGDADRKGNGPVEPEDEMSNEKHGQGSNGTDNDLQKRGLFAGDTAYR